MSLLATSEAAQALCQVTRKLHAQADIRKVRFQQGRVTEFVHKNDGTYTCRFLCSSQTMFRTWPESVLLDAAQGIPGEWCRHEWESLGRLLHKLDRRRTQAGVARSPLSFLMSSFQNKTCRRMTFQFGSYKVGWRVVATLFLQILLPQPLRSFLT